APSASGHFSVNTMEENSPLKPASGRTRTSTWPPTGTAAMSTMGNCAAAGNAVDRNSPGTRWRMTGHMRIEPKASARCTTAPPPRRTCPLLKDPLHDAVHRDPFGLRLVIAHQAMAQHGQGHGPHVGDVG